MRSLHECPATERTDDGDYEVVVREEEKHRSAATGADSDVSKANTGLHHKRRKMCAEQQKASVGRQSVATSGDEQNRCRQLKFSEKIDAIALDFW